MRSIEPLSFVILRLDGRLDVLKCGPHREPCRSPSVYDNTAVEMSALLRLPQSAWFRAEIIP